MTIPTAYANIEDVIVYLDFITTEFDDDLDANTINSIVYGQRFPGKVYENSVEQSIKVKLLYPIENGKHDYARLAIFNFPGGTSTDPYKIKIPYIKNARKQMNFKVTFVHYSSNGPYPIYLFEHDFTGMKTLEDNIAVKSV